MVGDRDMEAEFLKVQKQLTAIQQSFRFIEQSGLDRDILVAYLKDRTGMGKNAANTSD